MPFDTQPGDVPIPITTHTLRHCRCGHDDDAHEAVETSAGDEQTALVICLECDADAI